MIRAKQAVQTIGLLVLSGVMLISSYPTGQAQTQSSSVTPMAINAFGAFDRINDGFIDGSNKPAPLSPSRDLIAQRLLILKDAFGQDVLRAEWRVRGGPIPTNDNFVSVYFMRIDEDNNTSTGRRNPEFGFGEDISMLVQYQRGLPPLNIVRIWPVGGGDNPAAILQATASVDSERNILALEIPLATLTAQYQAVRGRSLVHYSTSATANNNQSPGFLSNSVFAAETKDLPSPTNPATLDLYSPPDKESCFTDELLVLAPDVTPSQAPFIFTPLGLSVLETYTHIAQYVYYLRITDGVSPPVKRAQLASQFSTWIVELNCFWPLLSPPNDPGFPMQWNLSNQGQSHPVARAQSGSPERRGRTGADIGIQRAWDSERTDSSSVLIGVIDSGIALGYPDLAANVRTDLGKDFVQGDAVADDNLGHGTFVTSVIATLGNNGSDLAGISWKASIVPLKAADKLSFFQRLWDVIQGITWQRFIAAMDHAVQLQPKGLRVINLSAGGPQSSDLIKKIVELGSKDILFVTAAGNTGKSLEEAPIYPCAYNLENMICVAASTDEDTLAQFSSYSAKSAHLAAPGADVVGLIPPGLRSDAETLLGDADSQRVRNSLVIAVSNGTSFAAPHVAAVAALLFASCPKATIKDIKQAILDAAQPLDALKGKVSTGGRLRWPEKLPC